MTWMLGFLNEVGRLGRRLLAGPGSVVFEIRVQDGRPRVIRGRRNGRAVKLLCTGLPPACQQRRRNLWGIHG